MPLGFRTRFPADLGDRRKATGPFTQAVLCWSESGLEPELRTYIFNELPRREEGAQKEQPFLHLERLAEEAMDVCAGCRLPEPFGIFLVVRLSNGVSLDFIETSDKIETQHYAFLVSETEFDQIFGRIKERGLTYWADPGKKKPGEFNPCFGGRGVYFEDPSGNYLEIITRPYGGWK